MAGMFEQPRNAGTLFLGGTKISGADIRDQNGAHTLVAEHNMSMLMGHSPRDTSYRECCQEFIWSLRTR